jgi:hypothetical protein
MTYRVYVRWPDSRVSDKTATDDRAVAEFAYQRLIARKDLAGKGAGVAFTYAIGGKSQHLAFYEYDHPPGTDGAAAAPPEDDLFVPSRPKITIKKAREST